jgi:hypothetical protein
MAHSDLPDYAVRTRELGTLANARYTAGSARQAWAEKQVRWGIWQQPEDQVGALPEVSNETSSSWAAEPPT